MIKFNTMKKIYIAPETEIVAYAPCTLIATSLEVGGGGPSTENGGGFEGDATGASRGEWGSIWK